MIRKIAFACAAMIALAGGCSQSNQQEPLPDVSWLVPYTSDENITRHSNVDLDLNRAEELLGIGGDGRSLLKKTPFESAEQFQVRGPDSLAALSPPINGRSRFVVSLPAKMMTYDLATKTATFCMFDILIRDCIDKEYDDPTVNLSISSVGVGARAYSQFTKFRWTNPSMEAQPFPVKIRLEPDVAEQIDAANLHRIALVFSFGPALTENGPVEVVSEATRFEQTTVNTINARLERLVVYQPMGEVAGAIAFP